MSALCQKQTSACLPADNPYVQVRLAAFKQGLQQLGWIEGRNLRIEYRLDYAMATWLGIPKKSSNTPTTKSIGVWSSSNSNTSQRGKSCIVILADLKGSACRGHLI